MVERGHPYLAVAVRFLCVSFRLDSVDRKINHTSCCVLTNDFWYYDEFRKLAVSMLIEVAMHFGYRQT